MSENMRFKIYLVAKNTENGKKVIAFTENRNVATSCVNFLNEYYTDTYMVCSKSFKIETDLLIFKSFIRKAGIHIENLQDREHIEMMLAYETRNSKVKHSYVKYNNFWYEYLPISPKKEAYLYIPTGGCFSCDITGIEIVKANDFTELNWKNTKLYDDQYETGWLAPNGEFYGCSYEYHRFCARFVLKSEERELEKQGFVKISKKINRDEKTVLTAMLGRDNQYNRIKLTPEQFNYLKSSNISNFDEIMWLNRDKDDEKIF